MAKKMICTQCGTIDKPKKVPPGSLLVEIILWLCLLLPGLLYSIWRISAKRSTCPACGAINAMIPLNSPRAKQQLQAQQPPE